MIVKVVDFVFVLVLGLDNLNCLLRLNMILLLILVILQRRR